MFDRFRRNITVTNQFLINFIDLESIIDHEIILVSLFGVLKIQTKAIYDIRI